MGKKPEPSGSLLSKRQTGKHPAGLGQEEERAETTLGFRTSIETRKHMLDMRTTYNLGLLEQDMNSKNVRIINVSLICNQFNSVSLKFDRYSYQNKIYVADFKSKVHSVNYKKCKFIYISYQNFLHGIIYFHI